MNGGISVLGKKKRTLINWFKNNADNNEIKDIIKVTRSLKFYWILLKVTTGKIISQKEMLLNFLVPLIKFGLPLKKIFLMSLRITAAASVTNLKQFQNSYGSGMTSLMSWK